MCPQREALPFVPLHPRPASPILSLRAGSLPCCQVPSAPPVVPRVVLGFLLTLVPGSLLVLQSEQVIPEPPWGFRVDQSHPESNSHLSLSRASPGASCATQTQLNTALPSSPSVPQVSHGGCPVVSLSPVQIYPYELLLVKTRGRNQLPKDVDRTRLEVRRAFFTGDKQGTEGWPWQRVGLVAM